MWDAQKLVNEDDFCWILNNISYLPWFIRDIDRWASVYRMTPSPDQIFTSAGFILMEKGLASTAFLLTKCQENKGKFKTSVREYHLPSAQNVIEAIQEAVSRWRTPQK